MVMEKRSISRGKLGLLVGILFCSIVITLKITLTPTIISISTKVSLPTTMSLKQDSHYYSSSSSPQPLLSPPPPPIPPPPLQPRPPPQENAESTIGKQTKQSPPESLTENRIMCDRTPSRYDLCKISGPTVVDPNTSTFFELGPTRSIRPNIIENIQPYPRKYEEYIMAHIKNITLISGPQGPICKVHHNATALVFSAGGYTGNFFHDFNDGFIPLFITINTLFHDEQDFVIVITEGPDWWIRKYANLLHVFSKHPVVSLGNDKSTHCFPSAHLGLISHGFMLINQTMLPNSKTYQHFHDLLHQAYGQGHHMRPTSRPRIVLVSRKGSGGRVIINQKKLIRVMKQIGFDVILFEPTLQTPLEESYALISSSHVMIGVHGAALTHSLFLRQGAVFMQIVPIGVDWAAHAFFAKAARQMNLEYIEYSIGVEESSLVDKYGKNSTLLKDPFALQRNGKGWPTDIMDIYLKKQNVRLDLLRFKSCLKEGYKKAKLFIYQQGK
ncbi:hypothetical protein PIB30_028469 [Stylosanthes scabra]|uniref:Glycosyltransferase 61 catalytic domain-containing protein n=1 Tax=Stylosanthes scabra TaxID=79078 RepID=A0ABU6YB28_9FABA|nr:hypothetical protein [Stylosanthes scabra]